MSPELAFSLRQLGPGCCHRLLLPAELLPGLLMYVATDLAGCADAVITAVRVFCVSREGTNERERGLPSAENPDPESELPSCRL